MIEVINPGFYASIQDLGRFGYRDLGVPCSGVMDRYSATMANLFVGNSKNDAVLEMTLSGGEFHFKSPGLIAICGANMSPKLNGKGIKMDTVIPVQKDSLLQFSQANNGLRAYLAIKGGFLVPEVLGSKSYFAPITIKNRLYKGDCLSFEAAEVKNFSLGSKMRYNTQNLQTSQLGVYPGPEFDLLSKKDQEQIFNQSFFVTDKHSRMGIQIRELLGEHQVSILTSPVLPGTVQWTPSGQMVILMRDAQTTGGYPRILQLSESSINILAQKKTGDCIKFNQV